MKGLLVNEEARAVDVINIGLAAMVLALDDVAITGGGAQGLKNGGGTRGLKPGGGIFRLTGAGGGIFTFGKGE